MANVLEVLASEDLVKLQELADNLEIVLLRIAFDGMLEDVNYIKERQKEFERKYEEFVKKLKTGEINFRSGIGQAVDCVAQAYYELQSWVGENLPSEEDVIDVLYENLIFPDDYIPKEG